MLLHSPFTKLTIFLDADVYPCSRTVIDDLVRAADDHPHADVFLFKEGKRAYDNVNYVQQEGLKRGAALAHTALKEEAPTRAHNRLRALVSL